MRQAVGYGVGVTSSSGANGARAVLLVTPGCCLRSKSGHQQVFLATTAAAATQKTPAACGRLLVVPSSSIRERGESSAFGNSWVLSAQQKRPSASVLGNYRCCSNTKDAISMWPPSSSVVFNTRTGREPTSSVFNLSIIRAVSGIVLWRGRTGELLHESASHVPWCLESADLRSDVDRRVEVFVSASPHVVGVGRMLPRRGCVHNRRQLIFRFGRVSKLAR